MKPALWWRSRSTRSRQRVILGALAALGLATRDFALVVLSAGGFFGIEALRAPATVRTVASS